MRRFSGLAEGLFTSLAALGGVTACGNDETFTDAGTPNDAPDVDANASLDAAFGDVIVTTHSRCCTDPPHTLMADIPVFAVQPDGTLGDSGVTDSNGTITLQGIEAGAGITAVYPVAEDFQVVTVVGVWPGDELVFGDDYTGGVPGTDGTMTASWPDVPGATDYYIETRCGSNHVTAPTLTMPVGQYTYCQTATTDFVFEARGLPGLIKTAVVHDGAFTNGATVTLAAWDDPVSLAATIDGLPSAVYRVRLGGNMVVDDRYFGYDDELTQTSGAASTTLTLHSGGDRIQAYGKTYRNGGLGPHWSYRGLAPDATSADLSNDLPWVSDVLVGGQMATWIQVGATAYDAAVVHAAWQLPGTGEFFVDYDWTIYLSPGVSGYTWANVPTELAGSLPTVEDNVSTELMLVDLSTTAGYDQLRNTPEWVSTCPECAVRAGTVQDADVAYSLDGGEGFLPPSSRGPEMLAPGNLRHVKPAR